MVMRFKGAQRDECVQMPGKTARSARLARTPEKRKTSRRFGVHMGKSRTVEGSS